MGALLSLSLMKSRVMKLTIILNAILPFSCLEIMVH